MSSALSRYSRLPSYEYVLATSATAHSVHHQQQRPRHPYHHDMSAPYAHDDDVAMSPASPDVRALQKDASDSQAARRQLEAAASSQQQRYLAFDGAADEQWADVRLRTADRDDHVSRYVPPVNSEDLMLQRLLTATSADIDDVVHSMQARDMASNSPLGAPEPPIIPFGTHRQYTTDAERAMYEAERVMRGAVRSSTLRLHAQKKESSNSTVDYPEERFVASAQQQSGMIRPAQIRITSTTTGSSSVNVSRPQMAGGLTTNASSIAGSGMPSREVNVAPSSHPHRSVNMPHKKHSAGVADSHNTSVQSHAMTPAATPAAPSSATIPEPPKVEEPPPSKQQGEVEAPSSMQRPYRPAPLSPPRDDDTSAIVVRPKVIRRTPLTSPSKDSTGSSGSSSSRSTSASSYSSSGSESETMSPTPKKHSGKSHRGHHDDKRHHHQHRHPHHRVAAPAQRVSTPTTRSQQARTNAAPQMQPPPRKVVVMPQGSAVATSRRPSVERPTSVDVLSPAEFNRLLNGPALPPQQRPPVPYSSSAPFAYGVNSQPPSPAATPPATTPKVAAATTSTFATMIQPRSNAVRGEAHPPLVPLPKATVAAGAGASRPGGERRLMAPASVDDETSPPPAASRPPSRSPSQGRIATPTAASATSLLAASAAPPAPTAAPAVVPDVTPPAAAPPTATASPAPVAPAPVAAEKKALQYVPQPQPKAQSRGCFC